MWAQRDSPRPHGRGIGSDDPCFISDVGNLFLSVPGSLARGLSVTLVFLNLQALVVMIFLYHFVVLLALISALLGLSSFSSSAFNAVNFPVSMFL